LDSVPVFVGTAEDVVGVHCELGGGAEVSFFPEAAGGSADSLSGADSLLRDCWAIPYE